MFSNTFLPMLGGIENSVATFAEDFRILGHNCIVVTPEANGAEESTPEVLRVPSIKNIGGTSFPMQLPVPGYVTAKMDDFAPDIVHSHHPFLMGDIALCNARRLNVPLVLTYHTLWDRYADFFHSDTLQNIVVNLSVEYSNCCDCVVAPSKSLADIITGMGVTAPIEVIPTGIDLNVFQHGDKARGRKLLGVAPALRVAGYVGRVGTEKNLAWLCESALLWCMKDADARFAIVGPSEGYGATLRRIFDDAGLGDRLIMTGSFYGNNLADVYAALDVFTFASLSDTQGLVLAEAMAAGLPVVALNAPGARETVSDGVNGYLLSSGVAHSEYAHALHSIFADDARRNKMREESKRRSILCDRRLSTEKMLELYAKLRANPSRSSRIANESRLFEKTFGSLKAEGELVSTKAAAIIRALSGSRN